MSQTRVNPDFKLEDQGIEGVGSVYYNLLEPALVEHAVRRGEGKLGLGGAFLVSTGKHTGRSPKDKFVVRTPLVERQIPDTAKARGITEEEVVRDVLLAAQPTKAFVTTDQLAALATFLCSDEAASITGTALPVDGGWVAQ